MNKLTQSKNKLPKDSKYYLLILYYIILLPFALRPIFISNIGDDSIFIFILLGLSIPVFYPFRENKKLFLKFTFLGFIIFLFYTLLSLLQGLSSENIFKDFILLLCFLIGWTLFDIITFSRNPRLHFIIFIAIFTLSIIVVQFKAFNSLNSIYSTNRIIDQDYFTFKYFQLLLIPNSIALSLLSRKVDLYTFANISILIIQFFCYVVFGATRSSAIVMSFSIFISSISLIFRTHYNYISTILTRKGIILLIIFTLISLVIIFTMTGFLFGDLSIISQKSLSNDSAGTIKARFDELYTSLHSLSNVQLIFGLGENYKYLHIGIFSFLLKGGVLLFIPVVIFLYIYIPFNFMKSILFKKYNESTLNLNKFLFYRTASLIVYPAIISWSVILLASGGYSSYNFLGCGFGFGAFKYLTDHGISKFIK